MSSIDERIVQMQFDNANFEKNVGTSLSTLEKLKQALNLEGAVKGLENINAEAGKMNFSGLGAGIDTAKEKFSALEIAGITALVNITNKAMEAGERLVKALTIDQVTSGWDKYEQKVTAVQTIMAATATNWKEQADAIGFSGTQMEFVTEQLDKLNWFSDETSYSFTDMTANVGKFTSAGVGLADSVEAMQGISVWAAKSGQNTQSASRAMYNLAQALGTGAVKLIDWKSIENANMATVEFKQTAIDTAEALGTLKKVEDGVWETSKGTTVTVQDFNSALKEGWFSADVLMTTLQDYGKTATKLSEIQDKYNVGTTQFLNGLEDYTSGTRTIDSISKELGISTSELIPLFDTLNSKEYELSLSAFKAAQESKTLTDAIEYTKDAVSTGWMQTFEMIFGNYEESVELWSNFSEVLYEVFVRSGEVRNSMLKFWREQGGRTILLEGIANAFSAIARATEPVRVAFAEVFRVGEDYVEEMGTRLLEATEKFRAFTENIFLTDEAYANLHDTFSGVFSVIQMIIGAFKTAVSIASVFLRPLNTLIGVIAAIAARIGQLITGINKVSQSSKKLTNFIDKIRDKAQHLANILTLVIQIIGVLIINFIDSIAASETFQDALAVIGNVATFVYEVISKLLSVILQGAFKVVPKIVDAFTAFGRKLQNTFPIIGTIKEKITDFFKSLTKTDAGTTAFSKLSAAITALGEKVSPVFKKVKSGISIIIAAIGDFVSANAPKVFDALGKAFTALGNVVMYIGANVPGVLDTLKQKFSGIINIFKSIDLTKVANTVSQVFSKIIKVAAGFISSIADFVTGFIKSTDKFGYIKKAIKDFVDDVKAKFEELVQDKNIQEAAKKIEEFVSKINSKFKELNAAKIMLFLFGAAIVRAVFQIGGAFEQMGQFFKNASDLFGISTMIKKLTAAIKATTTITQIAVAMSMIAGSVYLLSKVPTGDLLKAAGVIVALGGGLTAMSFALSKFNSATLGANSTALAILAGSIAGLAASLWLLSKITNTNGLPEKVLALVVLIGALGGVIVALNKFAPSFKIGAVSILAVSASVLLLSKAFTDLSNNVDPKKADQAMAIMAELVMALGVLAVAASGLSLGASVGLLSIVGALVLMDLVFKYLIRFGTTSEEIINNIDQIGVAFGALAVALAITRVAGKHAAAAGAAALLISAALLLLTAAVGILKTYNWDEISGAALFLGGMALALGAALKIVGDTGQHAIKAGVGAVLISAAVLLLTQCVKSIYEMLSVADGNDIATKIGLLVVAFGAVAGLAVAIGYATKLSENAKTGPILAMVLGLGLVLAGIALIAQTIEDQGDVDALMASALAFAVGLLAFGAAIAMAAKASESAKMGPMVLMVAMVVAVAGSLVILSQYEWPNILAAAGALGAVMLALGKAAQWAGQSVEGALAMVAMSIPLLAASSALMTLADYDFQSLAPGVAALMLILVGMAGAVQWADGAIQGALALMAMSVPLVAAALSLRVLAGYSFDDLIPAATTLSGTLIAMAGAASFADGAITGAGAMLAMSVPLVAAALSLQMLVGMGDPTPAAIALSGVLVTMAAAANFANGAMTGATTLVVVGASLIEFAAAIGIIALAALGFATAVDIIVDAFIKLGNMSAEQVDNATRAIEAFGEAIGTGLAKAVVSFGTTLVKSIIDILIKAVTTIGGYVGHFVSSAAELIGGVISGFLSRAGEFITNVGQTIADAVAKLPEKTKEFYDNAVEFVNNLIDGFGEGVESVKNAVAELVQGALDRIGDFVEDFKTAASNLVSGFVQGILGGKDDAAAAGASLGGAASDGTKREIRVNSPSKVFMEIGGFVAKGFAEGISKNTKVAETASTNMAKGVDTAARDYLGIHSNSKLFDALGRYATGGFGDGLKKGAAELKKTTEKVFGDNVVEPAKKKGEELKATVNEYKGALDLLAGGDIEGGLTAVLTNVAGGATDAGNAFQFFGTNVSNANAAASEGSAVITGNTSVTDSNTHSLTANSEARKGQASSTREMSSAVAEATAVEQQNFDIMSYGSGVVEEFANYYGQYISQVSDVEPLEVGKQAVEALALACYEASKATEDASTAAKSSADGAKSKLEEIKDAFTKMYDGVKTSVENQMNIFEEYKKEDKITSAQILTNMEKNVKAIEDWGNNIEKLGARGVTKGLLEELAEMGPKGANYVEAFAKMTDAQLQEANSLFARSMLLPEETANKVTASYAYAGWMAANGFKAELKNGEIIVSDTAKEVGEAAVDAIQGAIDDGAIGDKGATLTTTFADGISSALGDIKSAASEMASAAIDTLSSKLSSKQVEDIGSNVSKGFAKGMTDNSKQVKKASKHLGEMATGPAKEILGIASPSKEFEKIGMYTNEGFANGLRKYSNLVGNAASYLGTSALSNVRSAVSTISSLISEGVDDAPVIQPVLDLSNIESGAGMIGGILGGQTYANAAAIQVQNERADLIASMKNAFTEALSAVTGNDKDQVGEVNFYIYGTENQSVSDIADEVEQRMMLHINRLRAAKA